MLDTIDYEEYFARDLELLKTEYNVYNFLVYTPMRFNGNLVAAYE